MGKQLNRLYTEDIFFIQEQDKFNLTIINARDIDSDINFNKQQLSELINELTEIHNSMEDNNPLLELENMLSNEENSTKKNN